MRNKLHNDGSIKIDNDVNIIVSPYSTNFYDEIEEGIKEPVRVLLELGYLTISSCQGSHDDDPTAVVVVVLDTAQSANELMSNLNQLGIASDIDHTFDHFGIEEINKLFLRQYTDYHCVKIYVYDHLQVIFPLNSFSFVKSFCIKRNTARLRKLKRYLS